MSADIEIQHRDDLLKKKYREYSKLVLLIGILYAVWMAIVVLGTYYIGGNSWAFLPLEAWLLSGLIVIGLCVIVEVVFIVSYDTAHKDRLEKQKPKPVRGKKLYVYSTPEKTRGGIFSRTYIKIDKDHALAFKYQMIDADSLWPKKK